MGRLRYKGYMDNALSYTATVGPFNDSETNLIPHSGSIIIGSWSYPSPPKEPDEGSERAKAVAERFEIGTERARIREQCTRYSVTQMTPELKEAERRFHEAESRILHLFWEEERIAKEEAALQAPEKLKISDGCKIIGRVVAWFQPPQEKR